MCQRAANLRTGLDIATDIATGLDVAIGVYMAIGIHIAIILLYTRCEFGWKWDLKIPFF